MAVASNYKFNVWRFLLKVWCLRILISITISFLVSFGWLAEVFWVYFGAAVLGAAWEGQRKATLDNTIPDKGEMRTIRRSMVGSIIAVDSVILASIMVYSRAATGQFDINVDAAVAAVVVSTLVYVAIAVCAPLAFFKAAQATSAPVVGK
ncbi:MAG: hypothetical protein AB8B58_13995 [Roseobacter sp.]